MLVHLDLSPVLSRRPSRQPAAPARSYSAASWLFEPVDGQLACPSRRGRRINLAASLDAADGSPSRSRGAGARPHPCRPAVYGDARPVRLGDGRHLADQRVQPRAARRPRRSCSGSRCPRPAARRPGTRAARQPVAALLQQVGQLGRDRAWLRGGRLGFEHRPQVVDLGDVRDGELQHGRAPVAARAGHEPAAAQQDERLADRCAADRDRSGRAPPRAAWSRAAAYRRGWPGRGGGRPSRPCPRRAPVRPEVPGRSRGPEQLYPLAIELEHLPTGQGIA